MEFVDKFNLLFTESGQKDLLARPSFGPARKNDKDFKEIYCSVYSLAAKSYRFEYVYKNSILNFYLKNSKKHQDLSFFSEFQIADSIADLIVLNGHSSVFEIKTEFDNFKRLDAQLHDYRLGFPLVSVVTDRAQALRLAEHLRGTGVGIYVLTTGGNLSLYQKPILNYGSLDYGVMFDVLRKDEVTSLLKHFHLPTPETDFYFLKNAKARIIEAHISKESFSHFLSKTLKKRKTPNLSNIEKLPLAIRFLAYNKSEKEYQNFLKFLSQKATGDFYGSLLSNSSSSCL